MAFVSSRFERKINIRAVYFEAQESLLCGRHCLNNILQGPHWETQHLLEIAQHLHEQENKLLDDDVKIEENFNGNEKDGFFSLSVLEQALSLFGMSLERAALKGMNLTEQTCFIVNTHAHWYGIRKIHNCWINMNSISLVPGLTGEPMKLPDEELRVKIASLLSENHDVFVVLGDLPERPDQTKNSMGKLKPMYSIKNEAYYQDLLIREQRRTQIQMQMMQARQSEEDELQRAMQESMKDCYSGKIDENADEKPVEKDEEDESDGYYSKQEEAPSKENSRSNEPEAVEKPMDHQPSSNSCLQSTIAVKHDLEPEGPKNKSDIFSSVLGKQLMREQDEVRRAIQNSLRTVKYEERRRNNETPPAEKVKTTEPEEAPRITNVNRNTKKESSQPPHDPSKFKTQASHHKRRASLYDNMIEPEAFMMVKFNLIPAPKNSDDRPPGVFERFPLKTATVSDVYRKAQENHGTCVLSGSGETLDPTCDKKLSELFPNKKWCVFGLKRA